MSEEKITSIPYKELLHELERRRIYVEKNRRRQEQKMLEEQLKEQRASRQNK